LPDVDGQTQQCVRHETNLLVDVSKCELEGQEEQYIAELRNLTTVHKKILTLHI